MREIALITAAGIKNNLRSKIASAVTIGVTLICVLGVAAAFSILVIAPAVRDGLADRSEVEPYLALILIVTNLIGLGVNLNAFAFQSLTREKSRGTFQSLLATPLEVNYVWLGKSLAVFIPGLVLGTILTLIVLIAINYIYFVPQIGFLITPSIAVSSFLAAPLIYLSLSLLVHLVGLTGKPATGNVIAQVFLPIIITLVINLVTRSVLDATSWTFTLTNLGIAFMIGIIVIFIRPRLTAERVVLSG